MSFTKILRCTNLWKLV